MAEQDEQATAPAPQAEPASDIKKLKAFLEGQKEKIARGCSSATSPDRIIAACLISAAENPAIVKCTLESWLVAVMRAAELGLEPSGGKRGMAYLVPRWDGRKKTTRVVFQIGYKGLMELVRRTNLFNGVYAYAVFHGDDFSYTLGTDPRIIHTPSVSAEHTPDRITHVYAVAVHKSGFQQFEVMTKAQCLETRDRGEYAKMDADKRARNPWATDEEAMCKKGVLARLCNQLPSSAEIAAAMSFDHDGPDDPPMEEAPAPPPTASAALGAVVKAAAANAPKPTLPPMESTEDKAKATQRANPQPPAVLSSALVNSTPEKPGVVPPELVDQLAKEATAAAATPPTPPTPAPKPETAEQIGAAAYQAGQTRLQNPFAPGSPDNYRWDHGFKQAMDGDENARARAASAGQDMKPAPVPEKDEHVADAVADFVGSGAPPKADDPAVVKSQLRNGNFARYQELLAVNVRTLIVAVEKYVDAVMKAEGIDKAAVMKKHFTFRYDGKDYTATNPAWFTQAANAKGKQQRELFLLDRLADLSVGEATKDLFAKATGATLQAKADTP